MNKLFVLFLVLASCTALKQERETSKQVPGQTPYTYWYCSPKNEEAMDKFYHKCHSDNPLTNDNVDCYELMRKKFCQRVEME